MKMKDAMDMIERNKKEKVEGFMVSFEWARKGMLHSDHFPDRHAGEELIKTEEEAWALAHEFAKGTFGNAVNIYVVGSDFVPVDGYEEKKIKNR